MVVTHGRFESTWKNRLKKMNCRCLEVGEEDRGLWRAVEPSVSTAPVTQKKIGSCNYGNKGLEFVGSILAGSSCRNIVEL